MLLFETTFPRQSCFTGTNISKRTLWLDAVGEVGVKTVSRPGNNLGACSERNLPDFLNLWADVRTLSLRKWERQRKCLVNSLTWVFHWVIKSWTRKLRDCIMLQSQFKSLFFSLFPDLRNPAVFRHKVVWSRCPIVLRWLERVISAGRSGEQLEHLYIAGWNAKWYAYFWKWSNTFL